MNRIIVKEGDLETYDSEGGFGPDGIEIGGQDMSEIIAELFGIETDGRGSLGELEKFGKVRLTIEVIDEVAA